MLKRFIIGTGGLLTLFLILLSSAATILPIFLINLYSQKWGKAFFPKDPSKSQNDTASITIIILSVLALGVAYFFKALMMQISIIWIGRKLHSQMTFRVLHSSVVNFLQRTPMGIILNRFSNDINNIDNNFTPVYLDFTRFIFNLISAVVSLIYGITSVTVLIPLFIFMTVSSMVNARYLNGQREISRLSLSSKSPVIGLQSSSISGGPLIRCLNLQNYFQKLIVERIHDNSKNLIMNSGLPFWFDYRILVSRIFTLEIPLYIIMGLHIYYHQSKNDSALVNFLFSLITFAPTFAQLLKQRQNMEINALSFERCFTYEDLPPEEGYCKLPKQAEIFERINYKKIKKGKRYIQNYQKKDLFKAGEIEFKNVSAWYPTSDKKNISDLNFVVKAGQKVGIVGRSGAGKSTFTKLLWRALEPQIGTITVDGIKIRDLDLKEFREQLNIILQKPNIFEGTLASNISSKKLTDSEIKRITNEMKDLGFPLSKLSDGRLEQKVNISGNNLSLSEQQVICLMQSLQKKSKIVIMDEATAYVDPAMEEKFNSKIMETFKDSTMFVIAHRIKSVMTCDRIMVFEQGNIIEDGSPAELLADQNTIFYDMWSKGQ